MHVCQQLLTTSYQDLAVVFLLFLFFLMYCSTCTHNTGFFCFCFCFNFFPVQAFKDELQNHKCSKSLFRDPLWQPCLNKIKSHSYVYSQWDPLIWWWTATWFSFGENPFGFESCPCTSNLPIHAYSNQLLVRTNNQHIGTTRINFIQTLATQAWIKNCNESS